MKSYPTPSNELARLQCLYDYEILDTLCEEEYDAITKIAAQICNVPASLITFLDKDRQWFKSHLGVDLQETPRELSFCNYTIIDPDNVLVISDLRLDDRFCANPLVMNDPKAVFYAGAPLVTNDGYVLGSICVLDGKPNSLSEDQRAAMKGLAQQVMGRLDLQKKIKEVDLARKNLHLANIKLGNFARIASHDMKTPLANICLVTRATQRNYTLEEEVNECFDLIEKSAKELLVFIDEILKQSQFEDLDSYCEGLTDSGGVLNRVIDLIAAPIDIEITKAGEFPKVAMNSLALQQVFQNLITNSIKYNDKAKGVIKVTSFCSENHHCFSFTDNGSGIEERYVGEIFNGGKTFHKVDRFGGKGTGLGLSTVKEIISRTGGEITATSQKNIGTTLTIKIPSSKHSQIRN